MPNGTGLMGGTNGSSSQQVLIIPMPLSTTHYYLFTTDEGENKGINGMRYSIVDMDLDNGLGDVTNAKNLLLFAPCAEKLAAVNHCNNTSVWIMGHEVDNNCFRAYHLTANGIDTNAVVSAIGFPHNSNVFETFGGPVKFSSNGKKVCAVSDSNARRVELFDFDNEAGKMSNCISLSATNIFTLSISFSSDNSKLYCGSNSSNTLFQYDVTGLDSASIVSSKILIYHDSLIGSYGPRSMQNTPDHRIFINVGHVEDTILYSIDLPNSSGAACGINFNAINLINRIAQSGLPNFNESYFNESVEDDCFISSPHLETSFFEVYPNPATSIITIKGIRISSVKVVSLYGTIGFSQAYDNPNSEILLNLEALSRGNYFLIVTSGNQTFCKKLLIQ